MGSQVCPPGGGRFSQASIHQPQIAQWQAAVRRADRNESPNRPDYVAVVWKLIQQSKSVAMADNREVSSGHESKHHMLSTEELGGRS